MLSERIEIIWLLFRALAATILSPHTHLMTFVFIMIITFYSYLLLLLCLSVAGNLLTGTILRLPTTTPPLQTVMYHWSKFNVIFFRLSRFYFTLLPTSLSLSFFPYLCSTYETFWTLSSTHSLFFLRRRLPINIYLMVISMLLVIHLIFLSSMSSSYVQA